MGESNIIPMNKYAGENDNPDNLEVKNMDVIIDSETGENKILGTLDEDFKDSFDEMVKKINESDDNDEFLVDKTMVSEKDIIEYLASDDSNDSIINEVMNGSDLTADEVSTILRIANRRINGEKFNVYKELPPRVKEEIDKYISGGVTTGAISGNNAQIKGATYAATEAVFDSFINEIQMSKAKNDFARDMETLYKTSGKEIADASLEYIDERNKAYREAAEEIEDEDKKGKLLAILDQIDEARALTGLKEFAKRCKIKSIELEKPDSRVYSNFRQKYSKSTNNICSIESARDSLLRQLSPEYTKKQIDAFLIVFCKQVSKYSCEVAKEHAYMYYVLYYCVMLNADKNNVYLENVKEVIANIAERNPLINK